MSSSPSSMHRVREIFLGAMETTVVADRDAFIKRECQGDATLQTKVESMLAASDQLGEFLEKPAAGTEPTLRGEKAPSEHIGPYKILQEIGEGGCGVVYMAEQERPVRRRVALKIIKLGMDTKSVIARFESERQALAMMDHPNIAKVLEAGATENGRPYFVMELVRGVRITDYCDQHKLSTEERLKLFVLVVQAIQHAHQKGIIHRDIKPSNILVTLHDGVPVPKIIDFGIAKAVDQRLTDKTLFTEFQSFIGTPAYMSPEQAEMSGLDIDTRSDIYALGVLLYELLVGSTPFDPNTLRDAGLDECRRTIREVEPASPSQRLSTLLAADRETIAGHRHTESMALIHRMRGDLDWIVMKCLEKDRQRRYATANALAMDVQRYMEGDLVLARPPSTLYRLQKAWRRNRLALSATAAVITALIIGIGASHLQAMRATRAEEDATRLRVEAETNLNQAIQSAERALLNEYVADMNVANHSLQGGNLGRAWQLIEKHLPGPDRADMRGFEWRYLAAQSKGDTHFAYPLQGDSINDLAFSWDGSLLAVGMDESVKIWNVREQSLVTTLSHGAHALGFVRGTNQLVSADGEALRVWHTTTWSEQLSIPSGTRTIAISQDGSLLATSAGRGRGMRSEPREGVRLWNTTSWKELRQLTDSSGPIAFTPDHQQLLIGTRQGIRVLDMNTGEDVLTLEHSSQLFDSFGARSPWLSISPDGKKVAAAGNDRSTIRLWDIGSGRSLGTMPADARQRYHTSTIATAAWTPDSKSIVTGGWDHAIQSWDADTQENTGNLRGHRNEVWSMAVDPSGETIASGGKDGQLLLWPLQASRKLDAIAGNWRPLSFSADGKTLAALGRDNKLAFFNTENLTPVRTVDLGKSKSHRQPPVALSRDHRVLAVQGSDGTLEVRELQGRVLAKFPMKRSHRLKLALSSTGSDLIAGSSELTWWNIEQPDEPVQIFKSDQAVFSDDDSTLMLFPNRDEQDIQIWDTASRSLRAKIKLPSLYNFTPSVALSADGSMLAIPTEPNDADHAIQLWDTHTGEMLGACKGHKQGIWAVAFSPDGKTLASASDDSTLRLWNVTTRQELLSIPSSEDTIRNLVFSPDGQWLATSASSTPFSSSGELRLLRAPRS